MFITVTHCTTTSKESTCRTICTLCQLISPKRDVMWRHKQRISMNSGTIPHCTIVEFGRGHTIKQSLRASSGVCTPLTRCVQFPWFNVLPGIFAVVNCSVLALYAVFCSGLLTWALMIIYVHYSDTLYKSALQSFCQLLPMFQVFFYEKEFGVILSCLAYSETHFSIFCLFGLGNTDVG